MEHNVPEHLLVSLLLCAFQYCIDRPLANDYISWLERYWDVLPPAYQKQIQRDIHFKIRTMKQLEDNGWGKILKWKNKDEREFYADEDA